MSWSAAVFTSSIPTPVPLVHVSVLFLIRDTSKATPLHEAAARGHEQVVDLLLSYKADINATNRWQVCTLNLAQLAT